MPNPQSIDVYSKLPDTKPPDGKFKPLTESVASNGSGRFNRLSESEIEESLPTRNSPSIYSRMFPTTTTSTKPPSNKLRRQSAIMVHIAGTRYDVVKEVAEEMGFRTTVLDKDLTECFIIWSDACVQTEVISSLKSFQRINHFPGMGEICRKDFLARNLSKMARKFPDEYKFSPKTWILPADYTNLQNYIQDLKAKRKTKTFIIKPCNGSMGHGIQLFRNLDKIPHDEMNVVQEYLDKPLLIDGYKFDLRVYVVMTSCDPLRAFLYNDGLVRLSTEPYAPPSEANLARSCMHLTNYSLNKFSDNFIRSEDIDKGSKRSIKYLMDYLSGKGFDVDKLWADIKSVLVKTLLVAEPHVLHGYRGCRPGQPPNAQSVCFEVLGFDIFLDRRLKPHLIEINRAPSFGTDSRIDYDIKSGILRDSFRLLRVRPSDRRKSIALDKAESQRRLHPAGESGKKLSRRRREINDELSRVRREKLRFEFENRNLGNFQRLFPTEVEGLASRYEELMRFAFLSTLSGGRSVALHKDYATVATNKQREEELLQLLEECELDESNESSRPKPLSSMPPAETPSRRNAETTTDEEEEPRKPVERRRRSGSLPATRRIVAPRKPPPARLAFPLRNQNLQMGAERSGSERNGDDDERIRDALSALNSLRIKYPGRGDVEAADRLGEITANWGFHKPRVGAYWLVKLDAVKRRRLLDIVQDNAREVVRKVWMVSEPVTVPLWMAVVKVINRLLWNHGQGLWAAFDPGTGDSVWESTLLRDKTPPNGVTLDCCRRVVQLAKDCLLTVYQLSLETRPRTDSMAQTVVPISFPSPSSLAPLSQRLMRIYGREVPSYAK